MSGGGADGILALGWPSRAPANLSSVPGPSPVQTVAEIQRAFDFYFESEVFWLH